MAAELLTAVIAPPGGVMTDEAGVVTGALELRTTLGLDDAVDVHVRYVGALDWYRVTGTTGLTLTGAENLEAAHRLLCGVLHRPSG